MDLNIIFGFIGTTIATAALVYAFLRNFKDDINIRFAAMEKRLDLQDERIFLLATGKTLKEAMIEAKKNTETKCPLV